MNQSNSQEEYEVEKILDKCYSKKRVYYQIKWNGYPKSQSTWEPLSNLNNLKEDIKEYERRQQKQRKKNKKTQKKKGNKSKLKRNSRKALKKRRNQLKKRAIIPLNEERIEEVDRMEGIEEVVVEVEGDDRMEGIEELLIFSSIMEDSEPAIPAIEDINLNL